MSNTKTGAGKTADYLYYVVRIATLVMVVIAFFPQLNPAKICEFVNKNMSLFTSGVSYGGLTKECGRAFRQGWIQESSFRLLFASSMIS